MMRDAETRRVQRMYDKVAPRYDRLIELWERVLFAGGRRWVYARATGDVLKIALGTGRNLPSYGHPGDVIAGLVQGGLVDGSIEASLHRRPAARTAAGAPRRAARQDGTGDASQQAEAALPDGEPAQRVGELVEACDDVEEAGADDRSDGGAREQRLDDVVDAIDWAAGDAAQPRAALHHTVARDEPNRDRDAVR